MRKHFAQKLLLVVCIACLALCAAACNKNKQPAPEPPAPQEKSAYLDIDKTQAELVLGRDTTITADYGDGAEGDTLSFTADSDVVTVDGNGKITAYRPGETVVRVKYGDLEKTCAVTVTLGDLTPKIDFLQLDAAEDEVTVSFDEKVNLEARISFDGKYFDDAQFAYSVADPAVGAVEEGVFTPAAAGSTDVTVTASWRGITDVSITETIKVTVTKSVTFSIDGIQNSVTLYTADTLDGQSYATELTVTPHLFVNGVDRTGELSVSLESNDDSAASYDAASKKLTAVAQGTAELVFSLASEDFERRISVSVVRPVADKSETVYDFDASEQTLPEAVAALFGGDALIDAECEGETLHIDAGNKLSGFTITGEEARTVTLYTATYGYTVGLLPITKVLKTAADLDVFRITKAATASAAGTRIDGYYVLGGNIDAQGVRYEHGYETAALSENCGAAYECGFYGVFDGRGHAIDGITFGKGGLFGAFGGSAVVKNVAFTNVTISDTHANRRRSSVLGEVSQNGFTVSNVYIELETLCLFDDKSKPSGAENFGGVIVCQERGELILDNVVIDYPENADVKLETGVRVGSLFGSLFTGPVTASDVYVISPTPLCRFFVGGSASLYDASNIAVDTSVSGNHTIPGAYRYETVGAMREASGNYSSFDAAYWDTASGIPVWKEKIVRPESVTLPAAWLEVDGEGKIDLKAIPGLENVEIGSVTYDSSPVDCADGKIAATVDKHAHVIVVTSAESVYTVSVTPVTKIIENAADLDVFKITEAPHRENASSPFTGEGTAIDGYYVLGGDIDMQDAEYAHTASGLNTTVLSYGGADETGTNMAKVGFYGIFDGNGHTISNITFGDFGLFGVVSGSAVVKNVGFTGVKFANKSTTARHNMVIAMYSQNGFTVSDVYVRLESLGLAEEGNGENFTAPLIGMSKNLNLSHIVIDCADDLSAKTPDNNKKFGSLVARVNGTFAASDVYVISKTPLSHYYASNTEYLHDASNKSVDKKITGTYRYDTADEMKEASHDYSSFDSGFWTVSEGEIPVWKTAAVG